MLHTPWVGGIYMFLLLSNTEISSVVSDRHFNYKKTTNILLIKTNINEGLTKFERVGNAMLGFVLIQSKLNSKRRNPWKCWLQGLSLDIS